MTAEQIDTNGAIALLEAIYQRVCHPLFDGRLSRCDECRISGATACRAHCRFCCAVPCKHYPDAVKPVKLCRR